jgi:hypothetical protein
LLRRSEREIVSWTTPSVAGNCASLIEYSR